MLNTLHMGIVGDKRWNLYLYTVKAMGVIRVISQKKRFFQK
jgi:hypothetical protein